MEPACKRPRIPGTVILRFDQTNAVRTLVDLVSSILTRLSFRITTEEGQTFLSLDAVDTHHVCMVKARLLCEQIGEAEEDLRFCVDSQLLNSIIKHVESHYSIDFHIKADGSHLSLMAYESITNNGHEQNFVVPVLVNDEDVMKLKEAEYDHTLIIDLNRLRKFVKLSSTLQADCIEFSVEEREKNGSDRVHCIRMKANCDGSPEELFRSKTKKDGDAVIRASTESLIEEEDMQEGTVVYRDSFAVTYLSLFFRSMEKACIKIQLMENYPLYATYPLGTDNSFVSFVLAPKHKE